MTKLEGIKVAVYRLWWRSCRLRCRRPDGGALPNRGIISNDGRGTNPLIRRYGWRGPDIIYITRIIPG
jgi:hypothetical protein